MRKLTSPNSANNGLVPSQLHVADAMTILSNIGNKSLFLQEYVRNKNILEIASGGYTDLVTRLKQEGARSAFSMDIVGPQPGAISNLHLSLNVHDCDRNIPIVGRTFGGRLPDTVIITSVFGAPTLSLYSTEKWLSHCRNYVANDGVIILDFMSKSPLHSCIAMYLRTTDVTRSRFERQLSGLKSGRAIQSYYCSEIPNDPVRYKKARRFLRPPRRPQSYTYLLKAM